MTQDEIIRMAREAGFLEGRPMSRLNHFAALVAAHEREACAKESLDVLESLREETIAQCQQGLIEAYKLGQSEEREACAKVCDELKATYELDGLNGTKSYHEAAAAIRARGE